MIPNVSNLPDIVSDPVHLPVTCEAVLQVEEEEEPPALSFHEVGSPCAGCGRKCVLLLKATRFAITGLHQLLISGQLNILCTRCIREGGLLRPENGR